VFVNNLQEKKKKKTRDETTNNKKIGYGTLFGNDLHRVFFSPPSSLVELLLVFGQLIWAPLLHLQYGTKAKRKKKRMKAATI
jgi:hypothetical protein